MSKFMIISMKIKVFPGGSVGKESSCYAEDTGDMGSIPGSGRSPGEGNGNPLQYSGLENPMDRGAWQAAVHGVTKSWTRLNDFTFTFHFHALQKEMATHSSVLAWRIPGTGEPGGLPSMGSQSRTRLKRLSSSSSSGSSKEIVHWAVTSLCANLAIVAHRF